jgi:hypothetical protein
VSEMTTHNRCDQGCRKTSLTVESPSPLGKALVGRVMRTTSSAHQLNCRKLENVIEANEHVAYEFLVALLGLRENLACSVLWKS